MSREGLQGGQPQGVVLYWPLGQIGKKMLLCRPKDRAMNPWYKVKPLHNWFQNLSNDCLTISKRSTCSKTPMCCRNLQKKYTHQKPLSISTRRFRASRDNNRRLQEFVVTGPRCKWSSGVRNDSTWLWLKWNPAIRLIMSLLISDHRRGVNMCFSGLGVTQNKEKATDRPLGRRSRVCPTQKHPTY